MKGLNQPLRLACTVNPTTGAPFIDLEDICNYAVKYEASLKSIEVDGQGPQGKRKRLTTTKNSHTLLEWEGRQSNLEVSYHYTTIGSGGVTSFGEWERAQNRLKEICPII